MLDMIEREHGIEQHEARIVLGVDSVVLGAARRLRPCLCERGLEHRRGVVADEPDGAAGKPRQPRHERRLELRHELAEGADEGLVGLGRDT